MGILALVHLAWALELVLVPGVLVAEMLDLAMSTSKMAAEACRSIDMDMNIALGMRMGLVAIEAG